MPLAFSVEGRLGLNISKFISNAEKAAKSMQSFKTRVNNAAKSVITKGFKLVGNGILKLAKQFPLLASAGAAAFLVMTKASLQVARDIEELATTTASTTKEIQSLTIAFAGLGLETNDVSDVLNTLADRSKDAEDGMQSFIDDFKLVGIEVDDLKGKRPAELFDTFADAIAKTVNPTKRQAAIVRILGDDLGRKLGPALMQGTEGFKALLKEAEASGAIMSSGVVKAAADASRNFKKLSVLTKAGVTAAFAELAPFIQLVSEKLKAFLNLGGETKKTMIPALKNIIKFFGKVGDVVRRVSLVIEAMGVVWDAFKVGALVAINEVNKALSFFGTNIVRAINLPLQGILEIAGLFTNRFKDELNTLKNFKIELPEIDTESGLANLDDSVKAFKESLDEPLPSALAANFINELDVLTAKLEKTALAAEELRISDAGKALGESATDDMDKGAKANLELFSNTIQKTLGTELEAVLKGNFDNIGGAFKSLLIKMAAEALAADIGGLIGLSPTKAAANAKPTGGSGFLSGAAKFLGFADGGNPPINKPSIVGEKGPELFIPRGAGTVVPNGQGVGGSTVVNNFNITTRDPETFRSSKGRIFAQVRGIA